MYQSTCFDVYSRMFHCLKSEQGILGTEMGKKITSIIYRVASLYHMFG